MISLTFIFVLTTYNTTSIQIENKNIMEIPQKNVVYIGGCGGIGSAVCKRFVDKRVANLAILDLIENVDLIKDMKTRNTSTNILFLKIDLRCKETITKCLENVISWMGHIDILVNGGGLYNENDAELTISVNLLGLINSTMVAIDLMDKSKGNCGGLIINIASVAGVTPFHTSPIYCASKAGIVLFTRSIAKGINFEVTGVSLITICPGFTETPLLGQIIKESRADYVNLLNTYINGAKKQSPNDCAQSIIEAIEANKNGAVYICDVAKIKEVTFEEHWIPEKL